MKLEMMVGICYTINESIFFSSLNLDVVMMSPPHTPPRRRNYQGSLKAQGMYFIIYIQPIFMQILQK
jgi:hypothetical protein